MSIDKSDLEGLSRKEKRDLNREVARIKREEEAKRRKRNTILRRTGLIVAIVAVLAVIGLVIYNTVRAGQVGPANMISDGVILQGDGTTATPVASSALSAGGTPVASTPDAAGALMTVTEYLDYGDADSVTFDTTNGSNLQGWAQAGYVSLELHPVAFGDADNDGYSTRAANTLACVANYLPAGVLPVHNSLMAVELDDNGLSNDELVTLVSDAGIDDETIAGCIRGGEFADWVAEATARARAGIPNSDTTPLTTVPLVLVNQVAWTGALDDAEAFAQFIADSADVTTDDGSEDPTDDPTEEPTTDPTDDPDE